MATEDYSALEHIAKSLYLHRWREPLFAMLTAYFEDSGSHGDTKALVICGYVSTVDQWMHFEKDFRRVLGMPQFGLDELHMKTLRNNKKFKDNLGLQRDLFERVSLLLRCRIMETFGGSVLLDDYDRMNQEYAIRETLGPPLVMAAQLAIHKLMRWKTERHPSDDIQIVFDQGIAHWGLLDDRVYEEYGFRLQPAKVSKTPALQAGDFTAWELHRALSEMVKQNRTSLTKLDSRGSFVGLVEKLGIKASTTNWFIYDESEMRRVFPLHPGSVPRRDAVVFAPPAPDADSS